MVEKQALSVSQTLSRVPVFSGLTEQELAFLTERTVERKVDGGEIVFSEGDPCSGLFVVRSGNIRIYKSAASGREQVLAIEGPGSSIAELPVFDGGNYPASAQAVSESRLLFVSKKDFQDLCMKHPDVALKVLKVVGSRLRRLVGIIEELSFTTVRHRLAALLVRMAKAEGKTFTLNANNQELAAQLGTVRELVSRNLSRLQAEGLIELEGRTVTVKDVGKLAAELSSEQ